MITLALIGVGRWGGNFLNTVKRMNTCNIKYIASRSVKTISQLPSQYIKTTNYKDFLKCSDIDGVIIATPGSTHYEIIKTFLSTKQPMLVEKPFTTNYKNALNIRKLVKGKPNIMVGHIYLYNPAYLTVKKLVPRIGKLRYISFKGYNYGPFRNDMSALWEWAPHGVSICLDLIDDQPLEVTAWVLNSLRPKTKLYDNIQIQLKFKNGIVSLLEFGWLYPYKRRELIIYGSKSTILFDD